MATVQVFCLDNSDLIAFEAKNRGYRGDVFVKISNQYYNLIIYDIVRLKQDFESEIEQYGMFSPEPNLVLVNEVNYLEIINLVNHLYNQKYFERIKPVDSSEICQQELVYFNAPSNR